MLGLAFRACLAFFPYSSFFCLVPGIMTSIFCSLGELGQL